MMNPFFLTTFLLLTTFILGSQQFDHNVPQYESLCAYPTVVY